MANIREELTLVDNFSSTYKSFINMSKKAARSAEMFDMVIRQTEQQAASTGTSLNYLGKNYAYAGSGAMKAAVNSGTLGASMQKVAIDGNALSTSMVVVLNNINSMAVSTQLATLKLNTMNTAIRDMIKLFMMLKMISIYRQFNLGASAAIEMKSSIALLSGEVNKTSENVERLGEKIKKATTVGGTYLERVKNKFRQIGEGATQATTGSTNLLSSLKGYAVAAIGIVTVTAAVSGLKKAINLSDEISQTTARLNLMNDGLQTTAQLNDMIFQAAQRARTPYQTLADSVSKMGLNAGQAFNSNQEMIQFMENISKQFAIGGASATDMQYALIQLTQAMGSGALRGDELNSILDAAPGIARNIEKSMGWASGSIKQYAEQGLVTAEVVKNAMLESTDEINRQFEQMPMTFAQAMTLVKNQARQSFAPISDLISNAINSDAFMSAIDNIGFAIYAVMQGIAGFLGMVGNAISWVGGALSSVIPPLSQIAAGVVTVISVIVGGVAGVANVVLNTIAIITNGILSAAEWIANTFLMVVYNIQTDFYNLAVGAIGAFNSVSQGAANAAQAVANVFVKGANIAIRAINKIIDAINKIPGQNNGHVGEVGSVSISAPQISTASIPKPELKKVSFGRYEATSIGEAWSSGYSKGANAVKGAADKVSKAFDDFKKGYKSLKDSNKSANGYKSITKGAGSGTGGKGGTGDGGKGGTGDGGKGKKGNVGSVDKVKSVGGDISLADEDVKIFRDLAERKYINNIEVKTMAPQVNATVNNNGKMEAGIGSVVKELIAVIEEESNSRTKKAHA